jgi:hypothetical protein
MEMTKTYHLTRKIKKGDVVKREQLSNADNAVKFGSFYFGSDKIILLLTGIWILLVNFCFSQIVNASEFKFPQETFTACQDKKVGADCSFNLEPTRVHGICGEAPNGVMGCSILSLMPPPKGADHRWKPPPTEVFSACTGASTGDTCSFIISLPKMIGICQKIKGGNAACLSHDMRFPSRD